MYDVVIDKHYKIIIDGFYLFLALLFFFFADWNSGEPNDIDGTTDCVKFILHQDGRWNDEACGATLGTVCQIYKP